ncbi:MAG: mechanosensitive ion channel family protein [Solirubrobacteraceae bacterium]
MVVLHLIADVSAAELQRSCGQDPGFFCREILNRTENRTLAEISDAVLGAPLAIVFILIGAVIANKLIGRAIKRGLRSLSSGVVRDGMSAMRRRTPNALMETSETSIRAEQRMEALTSVLRSVTAFVIMLFATFLVLAEVGIRIGPLLAGAGVLGVALGFGSQSLVKDFLSGLFILIEDQFGVGDIVDLDTTTTGTVEAVSLRTTRLRSVNGTVWHVPNGDIRRVGNMSQHWSRALLDIEVAYATNIEHAKSVIKRVADSVWRDRQDILDEPQVWGVEMLGSNSIVIRLVVKTRPSDQYPVSRQIRQLLKEEFDREGIEIPFPQQTVWHRWSDQGATNGAPPAAATGGRAPAADAPASADKESGPASGPGTGSPRGESQ